jgi:hypothetical protein
MDPMAQAFAYYNFNDATGGIEYTDGAVQPKYFNNELTFEDGFVTPDDEWNNYWREGQNAWLGWSSGLPGSGNGAKSLGQELAGSRAFAECQVQKVFQAVCLRDPDEPDAATLDAMATDFQIGGFVMKDVFAATAEYCTEGM